MMSKEYCRYIRTYSELEGLQHAHTLVYCGAAAAQGVVMELRQEQDGRVRRSAVLSVSYTHLTLPTNSLV